MTRQKLFLLAVVCTLSLTFTLAAAANITYPVDLTAGRASVTGSITTNGTLGPITSFTDFVSFNLMINDGRGGIANCNRPGTCGVFGQFGSPSALTATRTELDWNFNAPRSFLSFADAIGGAAPSGDPPCFQLQSGPVFNCGPSNLPSGMVLSADTPLNSPDILSQHLSEQNAGVQCFAGTGPCNPAPVPEPSTTLLFGSGSLLLGIILRRKQLHAGNGLIDVA